MTAWWWKCTLIGLVLLSFSTTGKAAERLSVFVSITPQKYFVQQIGKNLVEVQVMVAPGANPATYEPKPRQMVALSKAKAYFAIGVPFEQAWLKKIAASNPQMRLIHTDRDIHKIPMTAHYHPAQSNSSDHRLEKDAHEEDRHEPGGLDPHTWVAPPLAKQQARVILDTLQDIDPVHRNEYRDNCQNLITRIDALDTQLRTIFAGKSGLQFMVFHPAWGYFAQAYGIEQVPVEIEGKNPKPAQLKTLIQHAREKGIKVVFVQPQFSTKSAELIAKAIGGRVVAADPLAEDWLDNLKVVADHFNAALR